LVVITTGENRAAQLALRREARADWLSAPLTLDLTDEETTALARVLRDVIDADRYPPSARVQMLKGILAKIRPEPVREPGFWKLCARQQ
jgi:hypothetical protein